MIENPNPQNANSLTDNRSVNSISMQSTSTRSVSTMEVSELQKCLAESRDQLKAQEAQHKDERLQLQRLKMERDRLLQDQANYYHPQQQQRGGGGGPLLQDTKSAQQVQAILKFLQTTNQLQESVLYKTSKVQCQSLIQDAQTKLEACQNELKQALPSTEQDTIDTAMTTMKEYYQEEVETLISWEHQFNEVKKDNQTKDELIQTLKAAFKAAVEEWKSSAQSDAEIATNQIESLQKTIQGLQGQFTEVISLGADTETSLHAELANAKATAAASVTQVEQLKQEVQTWKTKYERDSRSFATQFKEIQTTTGGLITGLRQSAVDMEAKTQALEAEKRGWTLERKQFVTARQEQQTTMEELEMDLMDARSWAASKILTLEDELDSVEARTESLEQEQSEWAKEKKELTGQGDEQKKTIEKLENEMLGAQSSMEQEAAKVEQLEKELEELQSKSGKEIERATTEISQLIFEIDSLQTTCETLEADKEELSKKNEGLSGETRQTQETIVTLQKELQDARDDSETRELALNGARKERKSMMESVSAEAAKVKQLEKELEELRSNSAKEVQTATAEISKKKNEIALLQTKCEALEVDKQDLSKTNEYLSGDTQQTEEIIENMKKELQDARDDGDTRELVLQEELKEHYSMTESISADLVVAQERVSSLVIEIEDLKTAQNENTRESSAESEKLCQTIVELGSAVAALKAEKVQLAGERDANVESMKEQQEMIEMLEKFELKEDHSKTESISAALFAAQERVSSLLIEVEALQTYQKENTGQSGAESEKLCQTIEELGSAVAALNLEKVQLVGERDANAESMKEQQVRIEILETELDSLKLTLADRSNTQQVDCLGKGVSELTYGPAEDSEDLVTKEREAIDQFKSKVASLDAENTKLCEENDRQRLNLETLRSKLEQAELQVKEKDSHILRGHSNEAENASKDLADSQELVKSLSQQVDELKAERAKATENADAGLPRLQVSMDELQATNDMVEQDNAKLCEEESVRSKQEKEQNPSPEDLNRKLKATEDENESLRHERVALWDRLEQQLDSINGLQGQLEGKKEQDFELLTSVIKENKNLVGESTETEADVEEMRDILKQDSSRSLDKASALTKQNEDLKAENRRLVMMEEQLMLRNTNQMQSIKALEKGFQELKVMAAERENKLREEVERQKVSLHSLYEDLISSQEEVDRLQGEAGRLKETRFLDSVHPAEGNRRRKLMNNLHLIDSQISVMAKAKTAERDEREMTLNAPESPWKDRITRQSSSAAEQGDILQSILNKKQERQENGWGLSNWFAKPSRNPESPEKVLIRTLPDDIAKMRSSLVKLQTLYKEESYKNQKLIKELQHENEAILLQNAALADQCDGAPTAPAHLDWY